MKFFSFVFQAWKAIEFDCGSWKVIGNYVYGEKSLRKHPFKENKMKKVNSFTKGKGTRTDFHSVEISIAHFDTVKYERFVMGNLKRLWKVVDF